MPTVYKAYKNSLILSDERLLTLTYVTVYNQGTGDRDDAELFFIDGQPVVREELPAEITAEVLAKLIDNAVYDPGYDFGGPVEFE